jgi:regulator of protease activity HflC (stomatin/prohibitin superfamily)
VTTSGLNYRLPWPIQTLTIVEAERIRGEGEAQAIRIYAEALSQDLDFYTFSRRLEAYGTVLK